jgi:hypothetical protein
MAIEIDDSNPAYLAIKLSGKLTAADYEEFVPRPSFRRKARSES